ncbi:Copper sensory histidine kinase CpxA [Klebsiella pneumoniae]|uniref:Copper sensory histidine kinase CpxA n=1 Tax=Klebsiella pneumoniae TaxID=573 RepID=A0A377ZT79_KLEPN|nr:Copper sensory histidine kinase CpxA [Klebsiella pneumoniae]
MIGSLTARIFAIFWLTLALVLMLVLMLPKLDSRQMTELLESEQRQGIMIEPARRGRAGQRSAKRPDVVASFVSRHR